MSTDSTTTIRESWQALSALLIGFFMILVDTTIVTVAMPHIIVGLNTTLSATIWVTSAYLLACAVPLLITGRLGDRFGPKRLYLAGLTVFTVSSAACGCAPTAAWLIGARVVQGLGAAMMSPQTMSVITRLFPPRERAQAMALWGAAAGVGMLVGPLLGGVLVDSLGWEWIFFVNIPVGIIGFVAAIKYVPRLPVHSHSFDIVGVILSASGMFLLVFGIQEGATYDWGTVTDNLTVFGVSTHLPVSVWGLILAGAIIMAVFVTWQALNRAEPLVPLKLFADRNFAAANVGITVMGFCVASMNIPLMLYYQEARGLTPTQSALTMIPMAVASGALSPVTGRLCTIVDPKWIAMIGFASYAGALGLTGWAISHEQPIWVVMVLLAVIGASNTCIWGPLSLTATRNLPPDLAGAGSGVYNTTRQIGSVLGSASIAAMMTAQISTSFSHYAATLPPDQRAHLPTGDTGGQFSGTLPEFLETPFSQAMGQSLYLPAAIIVLGVIASAFFVKPPTEHMR